MIENCYMSNEHDKCIYSNIWKTHLLIFSSNLHVINETKKEKCLALTTFGVILFQLVCGN